ncbi:hypothetical protein E2562_005306 [Oryza meyeriana var. granulata]|uniref:WRKY domain-containing protein n=1 Tax=Oryza meyeriana var. granulata TaxID=110450 RepID=A0A6G1EF10_9ORYZ|nr:hypothetical protein E2562_005306 [Oryza meyeriana var. granulata]
MIGGLDKRLYSPVPFITNIDPSPEAVDIDKRRPKRKNSEGKKGDEVTPVPHYDGHQWRKYGQRNINNSKHQRIFIDA